MTGVGPLIRKDLLLVARRRRWYVARAISVGLLLLITLPLFINLAMTYATKSSPQVASTVHGFFLAFAWCQFFLVLFAAPAFGARTLGDARNRGAVELLRLASISRPALASAKLVGATVWPLLLAVAALPFLAIWTLWGGVVAGQLMAIVLLTASTAVVFVAFGLMCGAMARGTGAALIGSYLFALVYLAVIPMLRSVLAADVRAMIHTPTALHQVLSMGPHANKWAFTVFTSMALALLCTVATGATMFIGDAVKRRTGGGGERRSRRVWGLPVMWREMQVGLRTKSSRVVLVGWVLALGLVVFNLFVPASNDLKEAAVIVAYGPLPALVFAVVGAMSIAGEKESGTIGSLLLTPTGAAGIVMGKFGGVFLRGMPMFLPPLFHALYTSELTYLIYLLSASLISVYLGAFGVLCSVIFKKTTTAVLGMLGGIVAQTLCTCNLVTILVVALPAVLMEIAEKGMSSDQAAILFISSSAYLLVLGGNIGLAIALFESQMRRALG